MKWGAAAPFFLAHHFDNALIEGDFSQEGSYEAILIQASG